MAPVPRPTHPKGTFTGHHFSSCGCANGRPIFEGPSGGWFFVNANGNATRLSGEQKRRQLELTATTASPQQAPAITASSTPTHPNGTFTGHRFSSRGSANGSPIFERPSGGWFFVNANGNVTRLSGAQKRRQLEADRYVVVDEDDTIDPEIELTGTNVMSDDSDDDDGFAPLTEEERDLSTTAVHTTTAIATAVDPTTAPTLPASEAVTEEERDLSTTAVHTTTAIATAVDPTTAPTLPASEAVTEEERDLSTTDGTLSDGESIESGFVRPNATLYTTIIAVITGAVVPNPVATGAVVLNGCAVYTDAFDEQGNPYQLPPLEM